MLLATAGLLYVADNETSRLSGQMSFRDAKERGDRASASRGTTMELRHVCSEGLLMTVLIAIDAGQAVETLSVATVRAKC